MFWTQILLKGSKINWYFKIFNKMKLNKNFAKKVIVTTALTIGFIGANSFYNESKALKAAGWVWGTLSNVQGIAVCDGASSNCTHPG